MSLSSLLLHPLNRPVESHTSDLTGLIILLYLYIHSRLSGRRELGRRRRPWRTITKIATSSRFVHLPQFLLQLKIKSPCPHKLQKQKSSFLTEQYIALVAYTYHH